MALKQREGSQINFRQKYISKNVHVESLKVIFPECSGLIFPSFPLQMVASCFFPTVFGSNRCIMWAPRGWNYAERYFYFASSPQQIVASCEHRVGGWPPAQSWSQMTRRWNRRGGRLFVFSDSTGIRDRKNTWSQTTRKQLRGGLMQQIKLIFPFKGNKTKISSFGHKQLSGNLS